MITSSRTDSRYRFVLLGITIFLCLNVFPLYLSFILALTGIAIIYYKYGLPMLLGSFAVFGSPFLFLFKNATNLSASALIIGIMLYSVVYLNYKQKNDQYRSRFPGYSNPFFLWLFFLYAIVIIQYYFGPYTYYSEYSIKYFLVFSTFFVVSGILITIFRLDIVKMIVPGVFFYSISYPAINMSIISVPVNLALSEFGLRTVEGASIFGISRLGGLLLITILIGFYSAKTITRVLPEYLLGIVITIPYIWFSYSRQVLVAIFVIFATLVIIILFNKYYIPNIRKKIGYSFIFISLGLLGLKLISIMTGKYYASRFSQFGIIKILDESALTRIELWKTSWELIKEKPVTGYGLGGFGVVARYDEWSWPHNWFVEAWVNLGIIGIILFIIGAIIIISPLIRSKYSWLITWAIAGTYFLLVVQVTSDIPRNAKIFMFISIIGVLTLPKKRTRAKQFIDSS